MICNLEAISSFRGRLNRDSAAPRESAQRNMPRTLSSSIVKVFPCTSVERFSVALRSSTHVAQAHVRSLPIGRLVGLPSTDEQERLEPWASLTVPPRSWHDQGRLAVCRKVNMEQTLAARNAMRYGGFSAPALGTLNTDDSRRQPWQALLQVASCHVQKAFLKIWLPIFTMSWST